MVFGSKRETKPDNLSREDVVGNLYPESLTSEANVTQSPPPPPEFRRDDRGNESVIDPHARFNGKYVSDRDLRIEGEAQGEIECQGTLIISPQARVRSAISAHNVIVNGDYEGDVDCGGRFEVGSTGRVKGNIKTQVLVVKEGAYWEGSVTMTRDGTPRPQAAGGAGGGGQQRGSGGGGGGGGGGQGGQGGQGGSIFSKQERDAQAGQREGQPAGQGGGSSE